jgi:hypothetical protein
MKNYLLILMLLLVACSFQVLAQNSAKEKNEVVSQSIKTAIENGKFVFKAQSATPAKGGIIQLTSEYAVSISPEEIQSDLPYFGRSFSGGYSSSDGGITFNSKDFDYQLKPTKKGGWDVTIKPADAGEVVKLFFSITSSGYATLRVTSTGRDSISFNGVIVTN